MKQKYNCSYLQPRITVEEKLLNCFLHLSVSSLLSTLSLENRKIYIYVRRIYIYVIFLDKKKMSYVKPQYRKGKENEKDRSSSVSASDTK